MTDKRQDTIGQSLIVIGIVGFLLTAGLLAMMVVMSLEPAIDDMKLVNLPKNHPLYGKLYTNRPQKTLEVIALEDGSLVRLTDDTEPRGGDFIIKDYADFAKSTMAALRGEGYEDGMTVDDDGSLFFSVPHFSAANITPIYYGTWFKGRLEATANECTYTVLLNATWTNASLVFRGYNDTVKPQAIIDGHLYRYNAALVNGSYWNFSIPDSVLIPGTLNDFTIQTSSGGTDWAIHGYHYNMNSSMDLTRHPVEGSYDSTDYYNLTFQQYGARYTYAEETGSYHMTSQSIETGNFTGSFVNTYGPGVFKTIEANRIVKSTCASVKSGADTTLDQLSDMCEAELTGTPPTNPVTGDNWYTVAQTKVMSIEQWNMSEVANGTIESVTLIVRYTVQAGYTGSNYIQYAIEGDALADTTIRPLSGQTNYYARYDLMAKGVDTIAEIFNLDIQFTNNDVGGPHSVSFDRVDIKVGIFNASVWDCGQRVSFRSEFLDSDVTALSLRISAYVNYTGQMVRVGYSTCGFSTMVNVFNITSTTPAFYEITIPVTTYLDDRVCVCFGSYLWEGLENDTLIIDSIFIDYVRLVATETALGPFDYLIGLPESTHGYSIANITYNGMDFAVDSTNYTLDSIGQILTLHFDALVLGTNYALNITVICNMNDAPVIVTTPITLLVREIKSTVYMRATDPEGDNYTWLIESDYDWATINATTGKLTLIPDATGQYEITIICVDEYGARDRVTYTIDVGENWLLWLWDMACGIITGTTCSLSTIAAAATIGYTLWRIRKAAKADEEEQRRTKQINDAAMRKVDSMYGRVKKKAKSLKKNWKRSM